MIMIIDPFIALHTQIVKHFLKAPEQNILYTFCTHRKVGEHLHYADTVGGEMLYTPRWFSNWIFVIE